MAMTIHFPALLIIGEVELQALGDHPLLQFRIKDWKCQFDALEEVAIHPVGGGEIDILLAARVEIHHAVMFKETADDRTHPDFVGEAGNAILTTFNEVNMGPMMALRKQYGEKFEKTHGVRLGFMGFFVKAACAALQKFPVLNASVDGNDIVYHGFIDIGIAVGSPRGLVVPIIRNADQLSIAEIEKKIAEFGAKAKDGKLTIEELTGGTFSISNGGIFGSMMSTPIINPPQSAILGIHATKDRAMVENGQVVVRPMNYLAMSYDHRIIDGREAVLGLVILVFKMLGLSINTMTLGGLAIAIGELVDDAVVDVENILRRLREANRRGDALNIRELVIGASLEVRSAIVYATLIIALVFVPLFALPGIEGRLFVPLGIAYIVSILASLAVSITVTPVLSCYLLPAMASGREGDTPVVRWLKAKYRPLLQKVLAAPRLPLAWVSVAVVLAVVAVPFFPTPAARLACGDRQSPAGDQ